MAKKLLGCCAALALALAAQQAIAAPADEDCSCKNLESLQQELANAEYLRDAFTEMAGKLRQAEQKMDADNKLYDGDSDVNINSSSQALKAQLAQALKLPHESPKGYTGPKVVEMEKTECAIEKSPNAKGEKVVDTLEELRKGSQCKGVADATLKHEHEHLKKCVAMGKDAYWDRPGSAFASEEAERYAQQADDLKAQLKKVIDDGTITVEAQLEPRIKGPQFDVTYSYVTTLAELKGKSQPGSDSWTLNGKAVRTAKIKSARIAGMNCTGVGTLKHNVDLSLETDGKTMGLRDTTTSESGNVGVKCKNGFGMSKMPIGEMGSGPVFSNFPLTTETNFSEDVSAMAFGQLINQNGLSATGKHTVVVKLICPGEGG